MSVTFNQLIGLRVDLTACKPRTCEHLSYLDILTQKVNNSVREAPLQLLMKGSDELNHNWHLYAIQVNKFTVHEEEEKRVLTTWLLAQCTAPSGPASARVRRLASV